MESLSNSLNTHVHLQCACLCDLSNKIANMIVCLLLLLFLNLFSCLYPLEVQARCPGHTPQLFWAVCLYSLKVQACCLGHTHRLSVLDSELVGCWLLIKEEGVVILHLPFGSLKTSGLSRY